MVLIFELSFSLQMSFAFIVMVWSASQVETDIVSLERVEEYTNVTPEVCHFMYPLIEITAYCE